MTVNEMIDNAWLSCQIMQMVLKVVAEVGILLVSGKGTMNSIQLAVTSFTLCALIGICYATGTQSAKHEYTRLSVIRDVKETNEKREAFWNDFEIYGRFVLASEVASSFDLPVDSIPPDQDSIMLIGYYVLPEKPPFGYFEFSFHLVVDGVSFNLGGVSLIGSAFAPKRLPFCKPILPPSGMGLPVPLSKLKVLLDKSPNLKLSGSFTK